MMLALLRHFHMGTLMRIEYASDPDWLRSHECTSDVNPIGSTSGGGLDAHSNRIILLFMIHARLRLPRDRWLGWLYSLAWLKARVYCSFPFCSCSNVGEEIGLFGDGQVEWYSMVKLNAQWFRCLQYKFDILQLPSPLCQRGKSQNSLSAHPGKLIFCFPKLCIILLLCITPTLISILFESAYFLCHVNMIDASIHFGCTLKAPLLFHSCSMFHSCFMVFLSCEAYPTRNISQLFNVSQLFHGFLSCEAYPTETSLCTLLPHSFY